MGNYINIRPITFTTINGDFIANAIKWRVMNIERGATTAKLLCDLINIKKHTVTNFNGHEDVDVTTLYTSFSMDIPNEILQAWGDDDGLIDQFVLTYSHQFFEA